MPQTNPIKKSRAIEKLTKDWESLDDNQKMKGLRRLLRMYNTDGAGLSLLSD